MNRLCRYFSFVVIGLFLFSCNTAPPPTPLAPTPPANTTQSEVELVAGALNVMHYFNDDLGRQSIDEVMALFQKSQAEIKLAAKPLDHETYKVAIPAMLQKGSPPDVFSYWAGARVQAVVDQQALQSLDELWQKNKLDQAFPPSIAAGSTYNGQKYFIPIGYHYVAFFYNKKAFETLGATPPKNWDELKALAEKFKQAGIPAFALGSRERWPAQFWFDYLLLRTAGPTYRAELMAGQRSYRDPEVERVMKMWQELAKAGYFYPDANAYDWGEAAATVARGQAAMTLMGTWITGYYKNELHLTSDKDYGYFIFPTIDEGVPNVALGPIDGFVMAKQAQLPLEASQFLAFLASPEPQVIWTKGQGALPPNKNVDPTSYDPLIQRVIRDVAQAETFAFNYDLATPPQMADVGLSMFADFMAHPDSYQTILEKTEASRRQIFAQ